MILSSVSPETRFLNPCSGLPRPVNSTSLCRILENPKLGPTLRCSTKELKILSKNGLNGRGFEERKGKGLPQVGAGKMLGLCGLGYWVQGFRCFPWLALNLHMAHNLSLHPSALQLVQHSGNLPMVAKPLYGILSDALYINGAHRLPYISIGGELFRYCSIWSSFSAVNSVTLARRRWVLPYINLSKRTVPSSWHWIIFVPPIMSTLFVSVNLYPSCVSSSQLQWEYALIYRINCEALAC